MADFCEKCGMLIDRQTGKCPNCDKEKSDNLTKKKSHALPIALAITVLIIVAAAAVIYFTVFAGVRGGGTSHSTENTTEGTAGETEENMNTLDLSSQYEVSEFDADEYFKKNTDLKKTISVRSSDTVLSERDAYDAFEERDFEAGEVYYEYLLDGNVCEKMPISNYSSEEHPTYQLYYSSRNVVWFVSNINGDFFATLLSGDGTSPRIIVSESDTVTSYDSTSNKYYINIPDSSSAVIKKVEKLDADALDKLAKEVNG